MSTPITIYEQNEGQISSDLTPPPRRLPKWLAWLRSLLSPVQWDHDLLFSNGWTDGSNAADWVSGNAYSYGDRVVNVLNEDNGVYECINISGTSGTTNPAISSDWQKVLDNFIGIRERAHYNGNKLILEWALNRYYRVNQTALVTPWTGPITSGTGKQIYITNNLTSFTAFYLSNGGINAYTSYMSNSSGASLSFLGDSYSGIAANFTVYVPSATAAAINANLPSGVTYVNVISAFINKYAQCNLTFNVTTY